MTRLISNSTRSSWAASADGGTGAPGTEPGSDEGSSGVLAAVLTWLPGQAGTRPPRRPAVVDEDGGAVLRASVLQDSAKPGIDAVTVAGPRARPRTTHVKLLR